MKKLSHFLKDTSGNIMVLSAITVATVVGAAGGSYDLARATMHKANLQSALDNAAIVTTRKYAADKSLDYQEIAEMYFKASQSCLDLGDNCGTPVATLREDGGIALEVYSDIDTTMLNIAGIESIKLFTRSVALPSHSREVDVMMALDYSGSMWSNNKYIHMAGAASDFLQDATDVNNTNMRVGIVPFARHVLTYVEGEYAFDENLDSDLSQYDGIIGCTTNRQYPYSVTAATPDNSNPETLWPLIVEDPLEFETYSDNVNGQVVTIEYVSMTGSSIQPRVSWSNRRNRLSINGRDHLAINPTISVNTGSVPSNVNIYNTHSSWTTAENAVNNQANSGYVDTDTWGEIADNGLPENMQADQLEDLLGEDCAGYADNNLWARPLSNDFAGMKTAINAMRPDGATNIALSLDFAWHHLTDNAPFTKTHLRPDAHKAVILLTDGEQTVSAHGPGKNGGLDTSVRAANKNIAESCEGMKAQGIEIFAIAFDVDDDDTKDLLSECATNALTHYHELNGSSGNALDQAFSSIFSDLTPTTARLAE